MNLIQKLMGRRQFLIAASAASASALTCKKLAGFETHAAMAADTAAAASIKAAGNRCAHLLSPLRIRHKVLKNRIVHTVAPVFTLQGPENYPTDAWRNWYSNLARNCAIITINTCFGEFPKIYHTKEEDPIYWAWEHISNNKWEDIPPTWNYVERTVEDCHCEGCLVLEGGNLGGNAIITGSASGQSGTLGLQHPDAFNAAAMRREPQAPKSVADIVKEAKETEDKGYDVYQMDNASLEAARAVRNATNLIILSSLRISGGWSGLPGIDRVNMPTASELEEAVEEARKLEGLVDFVLIRSGMSGGWIQKNKDEPPPALYYSEAIKKAGVKILTCVGRGFYDPIKNDEWIASGKVDMFNMVRAFFADPDLVEKCYVGRADDVIPCTQCDNCHCVSMTKGPNYAACTVNPKFGAPAYKLASIQAPLRKKKVAVIGGGPAGMKAALTAAERGHNVTLYEKDASMGGLQKALDYTEYNWGYKLFKNWLVSQVKKAGIEVKLNTTATPAMIKSEGYDTVLVATGAEPDISEIPGADADNVFNILTCYSNKKALGKDVVMIGAGKFGTETAIGMVLDGHKVTVLAPGDEMIEPENVGAHNVEIQEKIYKNHPDFKYFMKTTVKSISRGKVTYTDEKGAEKSIKGDSIVIYSGLKPRMDEAEKFIGSAEEVRLLGDCTGKNGTILKTIRSAFFVASRV